jgi:hypothetical protein
MHSSQASKLLESGKRTHEDSQPSTTNKQPKIFDYKDGPVSRVCSQLEFDKLLVDLVVQDILPFSFVESPRVKAIFKASVPNRTIMCRKTLVKQIDAATSAQKTVLSEIISAVDHVATTADSWKVFNKNFLGVTMHWLDTETLERKMTVLACERMKGHQCFDVLAQALDVINKKYSIQNKVVATTTDNGSNFVKAFRIFGSKEVEEEGEEDDDVEFVELTSVLDDPNTDDSTIVLPRHERCSAHTMNLIANHDAEKAYNNNPSYRRKATAALAQCRNMWNKQSSSSLHADNVKENLGIYLVLPNATRWNSTYDALDCLRKLLKEKLELVQKSCDQLGINRFQEQHILFINEYCKVRFPEYSLQ